MAIVLGRGWPYITPEYLMNQMDIHDVQDCIHFVDKKDVEWVFAMELENSSSEDLNWLKKTGVGTVVNG